MRTQPRGATSRPSARRRFTPPQHGAWAMLMVPWLAGVLTAGFRWPHLPLLGAWLAGYLLSYYALQALKTGRPSRFAPQLLLYGPITAALGGLVVAVRPQVLVYAPAYAILLAVNGHHARQRRERALANGLASVVPRAASWFPSPPPSPVLVSAGSCPRSSRCPPLLRRHRVLRQDTMIRERGSVAHHRASVVYHVFALVVAAALSIPLAVLFAALLARAAVLPHRQLTPKQVGIIEVVGSVLVLAAAVTAGG